MPYDIDAPLVAHDEALAGDTVFDLRLNHVWRRIVGGILMHAMEYIAWSGSAPEIEQAKNWYDEMVRDFYDETTEGGDVDYLGALVVRTAGLTAPVAGVTVNWETPNGNVEHDVGGFFDVADKFQLTVPVGGAGYYHVFARGFAFASPNSAIIRIHKAFSGVQSSALQDHPLATSLHCETTLFLDDGEFMSVEVRAGVGTILFNPYALNPHALEFGMFRIGL